MNDGLKQRKQMQLPRICILATYFGSLPPWFDLWLSSCSVNRDIDFLVVTDQVLSHLPENVSCLPETLDGMKKRLERVAGCQVVLGRAYKLCDYRPLFGLCFRDELREYDYWGHSDVDLIFGNLSKYFRDCDLTRFDKFLPLGHLFLFRNVDEVNARWRLPLAGKEVWREVVSSNDIYAFDERAINLIYEERGYPLYKGHPFADIATCRCRFILGRLYGNYNRQVFYWKNGKVGRYALDKGRLVDEEFLYVHFQKRPMSASLVKARFGEDFYLGSAGFIPMKGLSVGDAFGTVNPYDPVQEFLEGCLLEARRSAGRAKRRIFGGNR